MKSIFLPHELVFTSVIVGALVGSAYISMAPSIIAAMFLLGSIAILLMLVSIVDERRETQEEKETEVRHVPERTPITVYATLLAVAIAGVVAPLVSLMVLIFVKVIVVIMTPIESMQKHQKAKVRKSVIDRISYSIFLLAAASVFLIHETKLSTIMVLPVMAILTLALSRTLWGCYQHDLEINTDTEGCKS